MASKKSFLIRTDPKLLEALQKWAQDEMRSINGQIEYLLRRALMEAGRLKSNSEPDSQQASEQASQEEPAE